MKTVTFEQAFRKQLALAKPLTESSIKQIKCVECHLTKERFKPGETPLFVLLPEAGELLVVAVKHDALQKKGWKYVDNGTPVPRVAS